jgi:hypothetical protein
MTAADYGTAEELAFKEGLLVTLGDFIDSIDDIVETWATDYTGRRLSAQRHLLSSSVQISFTLVVNLAEEGYEEGDTESLVADFVATMDTALDDGSLQSNIIANADTSSPIAAAVVDVEASEAVLSTSTSTMVVSSPTRAPKASDDDDEGMPGYAIALIVIACILFALGAFAAFVKMNPKKKYGGGEEPSTTNVLMPAGSSPQDDVEMSSAIEPGSPSTPNGGQVV